MTISAIEAHQARDDLLQICDAWPALRARLHRSSRQPAGDRVSGSRSRPLVLDVHVLDLMTEIENEAASLARVLMDELPRSTGRPWTPAQTGVALLREIATRHHGHFTTGDEQTALAFVGWANTYWRKVRRTIEGRAPSAYMGDCPMTYPEGTQRDGEDVSGLPCSGSLYRYDGFADMRCPDCGQATTLDDQRDHVASVLEKLVMTQSEIRAALVVLGYELSIKTVQSWTQQLRGRPARLPEAVADEGLYRLSDAVELAEQWARRRAGARRVPSAH
ncbi:MAG: hypothetical protein J0H73_14870 [Salana multivorans]|uniref:hypothetical protein n=1 Tax=Salana multivorans TaxID=120377 RepID=UPI001AC64026|nr:hypothetical protein [Salana multivorans]MBN8883581.1 hypothetical protein [Salana multivorans]